VEQAQPHAGHAAIAELGRSKTGVAIVTQNVDDLHERAGSTDVVHLHGSLFSPRCLSCGRPHPHGPLPRAAALDPELRVAPPTCGHCGGPIRPGVVWFGESLPPPAWHRAERLLQACDALIVVGTSGVVQPAADLLRLVKQRGKPVVELNPARSGITPFADVHWAVAAAEGLPQVVASLNAVR
jgi:NAD-dependent deacetylase